MICSAKAIPGKCGRGCDEPCVDAFNQWGVWGKMCSISVEGKEDEALWAGVLKAKDACERHAIEMRVDGRIFP